LRNPLRSDCMGLSFEDEGTDKSLLRRRKYSRFSGAEWLILSHSRIERLGKALVAVRI
jgi:hypothetical protein